MQSKILISVSNGIQYREFEEMFFPLREIIHSIEEPDNNTIRQLLNLSIDKRTKPFEYANEILEEECKIILFVH